MLAKSSQFLWPICHRSSPVSRKAWTLRWKLGSRDGTVVRALAFHRCGLGLILEPSVTYGLSLLLFLIPAPRVFLQVLHFFLPPQKSTLPNSISIWKQWMKSYFVEMPLPISLLLLLKYPWKTDGCGQPRGHLIWVLNERSVNDSGDFCLLWLVILKSVWYSIRDTF